MKAAVVRFPGSNADWDAMHALRDVVQVPTEYVFHKDKAFPPGTDLIVLPGGFSFGDYLRCGAIACTSNIMPAVRAHADRGGLVLGICNGFQILTEAGMLPGALTRNRQLRFECRDVRVTVTGHGPFTQGMVGQVLRLPIAHAEGRFIADEQTLTTLNRERRVAFQYCDPSPNGSVQAIAGLYGGTRNNILGLMPHPERACEPLLGSSDGLALFHSVIRSIVTSA